MDPRLAHTLTLSGSTCSVTTVSCKHTPQKRSDRGVLLSVQITVGCNGRLEATAATPRENGARSYAMRRARRTLAQRDRASQRVYAIGFAGALATTAAKRGDWRWNERAVMMIKSTTEAGPGEFCRRW